MTSVKSKIRMANESDFSSIRKLWDVTFREDSSSWRDWYFKYIYKPQNAVLLYRDDILASMSHFNPYSMMLNGKEIKASSLAGIATREDMRYAGYAQKLIKESLIINRKRGDAFSFLYPFNYDFYRKYGYELCYENNYCIVEGESGTDITIHEVDITEFSNIAYNLYLKYASDLNGYITRDEAYLDIKLLEHISDKNKAYFIKRDDETIGYAFATDRKDYVELNELICDDYINVAKAFLKTYKKPAKIISPYQLDGLKADKQPHCMGRIIDVVGVFDGIDAKDGEIVVKVNDSIINENNRKFLFKASSGKLSVTKTDLKEDVCINIGALSALATGLTKSMCESGIVINRMFFEKRVPWIVEVC